MANAKDERAVPLIQTRWVDVSKPNLIPRHLGSHLRAMYDRMPVQPADDRIADLVRQLDAALGGDEPPEGA
ncbi:hypothetical protein OPKNFCMD_2741 [Methylobacterium crusticola]|uniref:Anti-sigma factor NepR domain-containing protein n=1 Tax=Methylobacterium crusticola TaxID=1697972 RepID=A0ABQ4QZ47_9HYPH|nr:NepR family anti-sigma factor [Methylobacterium crusticola]GJD50005.1 hypothetical protein OPKNFCMD_2741 [Methylobacterium crusticola]